MRSLEWIEAENAAADMSYEEAAKILPNAVKNPDYFEKKDTNPKDAVGTAKVPYSCLSGPVLTEMGLAMMEGARKYGRHNWRQAGIRTSVYYDACLRHLIAWWEGEDIDPDSGVHHVTKAISGLHVLRDAQIRGAVTDDRPPVSLGFIKTANDQAKDIIDRYPIAVNPVVKTKNS